MKVRERAWRIVGALIQDQPALYQARTRGRLVQACREQYSVSQPGGGAATIYPGCSPGVRSQRPMYTVEK